MLMCFKRCWKEELFSTARRMSPAVILIDESLGVSTYKFACGFSLLSRWTLGWSGWTIWAVREGRCTDLFSCFWWDFCTCNLVPQVSLEVTSSWSGHVIGTKFNSPTWIRSGVEDLRQTEQQWWPQMLNLCNVSALRADACCRQPDPFFAASSWVYYVHFLSIFGEVLAIVSSCPPAGICLYLLSILSELFLCVSTSTCLANHQPIGFSFAFCCRSWSPSDTPNGQPLRLWRSSWQRWMGAPQQWQCCNIILACFGRFRMYLFLIAVEIQD